MKSITLKNAKMALSYFYDCINGKLKVKGVEMLRFKGRKYESPEEMAEIMKKCFQKVFVRESAFV